MPGRVPKNRNTPKPAGRFLFQNPDRLTDSVPIRIFLLQTVRRRIHWGLQGCSQAFEKFAVCHVFFPGTHAFSGPCSQIHRNGGPCGASTCAFPLLFALKEHTSSTLKPRTSALAASSSIWTAQCRLG